MSVLIHLLVIIFVETSNMMRWKDIKLVMQMPNERSIMHVFIFLPKLGFKMEAQKLSDSFNQVKLLPLRMLMGFKDYLLK